MAANAVTTLEHAREYVSYDIDDILDRAISGSSDDDDHLVPEDTSGFITLTQDIRFRSIAAFTSLLGNGASLILGGIAVEELYICGRNHTISCTESQKRVLLGLIMALACQVINFGELAFFVWRKRLTTGPLATLFCIYATSFLMAIAGFITIPGVNDVNANTMLPSMLLQFFGAIIAILTAFFLNE